MNTAKSLHKEIDSIYQQRIELNEQLSVSKRQRILLNTVHKKRELFRLKERLNQANQYSEESIAYMKSKAEILQNQIERAIENDKQIIGIDQKLKELDKLLRDKQNELNRCFKKEYNCTIYYKPIIP